MMQSLVAASVLLALAAADEWTPVGCFPEGYDDGAIASLRGEELFVEEMEHADDWRVLQGGQNAAATLRLETDDRHSGAGALAVDYEFVGKPDFEYVALGRAFEIPGRRRQGHVTAGAGERPLGGDTPV